MSEALTLYCQLPDFEQVKEYLASKNELLKIDESDDQIEFKTSSGSVRITALFPKVGGKFGQVYMGTLNRIKRIPEISQYDRNHLHSEIKKTEMILGYVVEPDFGGNEDYRFSSVFDIARIVNGIVFDGFTFLSSSGEIVSTLEGTQL